MSDLCDLDLDLGSGHTAYRRVSLIDLYLQNKFRSNRKYFLWMDGHQRIRPKNQGNHTRKPLKTVKLQPGLLAFTLYNHPATLRPGHGVLPSNGHCH